ncbi:MAG: GntR family transcriptional regulator [Faecalibacterium sp.]
MEQYKTDAEIYAVLEREIIDLTIRPGSPLSENPLCARFGAPRTLIRMVLQRLKESGLVRIVPYKGTTVTRLNRRIVDELIYERTAVEAKVLRDFTPKCTPEQRALIRVRVDAYEALARAEAPDYNKLYEADRLLHETWFAAMDKMYLWSTLQNAHADYSRFRMLDTMTTGGLDEVIADHRNLLNAIERCDLAAFEPLVERHLYGGIRRLGSKLTGEYADYFEPETRKVNKNVPRGTMKIRKALTCCSAAKYRLSLGKINKAKKKPVSILTHSKEYGTVAMHRINCDSST